MQELSYEVRTIGPSDIGLMRELNALFGRTFNDAETYCAASPDDSYLATLLARRHIVVVVAVAEAMVIGGLVAYELEKLERSRSEFYIYDLAVEEKYRRRGVATACIECLQAIAAKRGGWVIFVQADYGDDPAISLYQKIGVREEVLHFDIAPRAKR